MKNIRKYKASPAFQRHSCTKRGGQHGRECSWVRGTGTRSEPQLPERQAQCRPRVGTAVHREQDFLPGKHQRSEQRGREAIRVPDGLLQGAGGRGKF